MDAATAEHVAGAIYTISPRLALDGGVPVSSTMFWTLPIPVARELPSVSVERGKPQ